MRWCKPGRMELSCVVLAVALLSLTACKPSPQKRGRQPTATPIASPAPTKAQTPAAIQTQAGREKEIAQKVNRVRMDLRTLGVGIESYHVDWNDYPEFAVSAGSGLPLPSGLTTPVAYLTRYLTDPFGPEPNAIYVYWKMYKGRRDPSGKTVGNNVTKRGWIVVSAGPDGDYDVAGEWDVFNPMEVPPVRLLTGANKKGSAYTYDPTNGAFSDGDIWRASFGNPAAFEKRRAGQRVGAGSPKPRWGEFIMSPKWGGKAKPGQIPVNQIPARGNRAQSEMRSMATAIEAYYVDHNIYPAFAIGEKSINHATAGGHDVSKMPSFRLSEPSMASLAKPMSYITMYPDDPFNPTVTYAYWSVFPGQPGPSAKLPGDPAYPVAGAGWILVSPGPDGDYDLLGEWDAYNPAIAQPSKQLLSGTNKKGSAFTYDPTNGLTSTGDLWRLKL